MNKLVWVCVASFIGAVLLLSAPGPASALSHNVAAKSVGKVNVNKGGSYVEIVEPHLIQWGKSNVLSFKVRLFNGSPSTVDLLRYGITVKTNAGAPIRALRQKDNGAGTKVLPQLSKEFAYYAVVPDRTVLSAVQFAVQEWNIDYPDFNKTIGTVRMPAGYTDTIAAGDAKIDNRQGNQIRLSAADFYMYETAKERVYTLSFSAESWGTQPVGLPEYSYWLQADTGELYPLESAVSPDKQLKPKEKRKFDLNAAVPKASQSRSFKLLVGTEEEDVNLIFHSFALAQAQAWEKLPVSTQKIYYIRPGDEQLQLSVEPLYISAADLPQMKAGTTVTVRNNGKHSVELPELAYFIEAKGMRYLLSASAANAGSGAERLDALEQASSVVSADIPRTLQGSAMSLIVAKSLGASDKPAYKPLLRLPLSLDDSRSNNAAAVAADGGMTAGAVKDGSPYTISLANVVAYSESGQQIVQGTIAFQNKGKQTIELPDLKLTGLAEQKYKYEGELSESVGGTKLRPQTVLKRSFRIGLPDGVKLSPLKLAVEEPVNQDDASLVRTVAAFSLNGLQQTRPAGAEWVSFASDTDEYEIRRVSTVRLPMDGEDAIVTELELYGKGAAAQELPELTASYTINNKKVEAQAIVLDNVIALNPGHSVSVQIIGKVPYTLPSGTMTLLLQQTEDSGSRTIAQFAVPTLDGVKKYAAADRYSLGMSGRESDYQMYQVLVYPGAMEDLVEIEFIERNNNKRSGASNPLAGYLQSADGIYYPLEYEGGAGRPVRYGGAAIRSMWGKVPKDTRLADLKLLLGLAVSGKEIADAGGHVDAYVKPALYDLKPETVIPADSGLKNMTAGPYALTLTNLVPQFSSIYSSAIQFNAILIPSISFDAFDEEHTIVIQIESGGDVVTLKEFGLSTNGSNGFTSTDRKYQVEGIATTGLRSSLVEVKVYLSYQGAMKLLGQSGVILPSAG